MANVRLFSRMVRIETGVPGQFRDERAPREHVLKPREPCPEHVVVTESPYLVDHVNWSRCLLSHHQSPLPTTPHLSVQPLLPFSTLPFLRNVYHHLLPIVRNTRPF